MPSYDIIPLASDLLDYTIQRVKQKEAEYKPVKAYIMVGDQLVEKLLYDKVKDDGKPHFPKSQTFHLCAELQDCAVRILKGCEAANGRYCNNHSYNKNATRTAMIKAAANQSPPVFGFDCVCLIKGILWGWDGDASRTYGGAGYAINGVPDIGADTMITKCTGVSTTGWDGMVIGEAVWMSGHIGIYIGDGLAVECSPKWENKVQITAVGNIGSKAGYNTRRWTKHGKLPYVDYTGASTGGGSQGTTQPSKPSEGTVGACVGDTVTFTGNKHYVSSNALNGSACKPGKAKVTAMAGNAKHPYHLIKVPGGGSTVYGWVDAADIQVEGGITVGSKVKVNKGAKTYTGGGLASFVYTNTYTVIQVDGDRVVIGQNGVVTAAVNSKDLTLVG